MAESTDGRSAERDTAFWHGQAHMPSVRNRELTIVKGEGCYVWTDSGDRLFDATASLWYCNIGHGRQEVVGAVIAQMRELEAYHTFANFTNRPATQLTRRLREMAPIADARIFLTSGGSDSVDAAAKLARRYWAYLDQPDKRVVVSRRGAYHGLHAFGTSLSGMEPLREGYGGELVGDTALVETNEATSLRELIETLRAERIAAFFCEPVVGVGGIVPPAPDYLTAVQRLCRDNDILLVVDEVITGFGRLGSMFASQRFGLEPDAIIFAKGVTSGYLPLGGLMISPRLWRPFWESPGAPTFRHGLTYGGHPACCAAGLANLDILVGEGLPDRVAEIEAEFAELARELEDVDGVTEVRTIGLLAGIELRDFDFAQQVAEAAVGRGLLLRALPSGTLQISPPLIATIDELGTTFETVRDLVSQNVARAA
jgi:adenosylmethionine-8-amino-7-oxononanoate aminotransferase